MSRRWYLYLAALVAFIAWRNGRVVNVAFRNRPLPSSYFTTPIGNASTSCHSITDPNENKLKYCEDVSLWDYTRKDGKEERLAIVSCDPSRKTWNTVMGPLLEPKNRGVLYAIHFDSNGWVGQPHLLQLQGFPEDHTFHPLGIEAWPSKDGTSTNMFVVNHAEKYSTIEQFTITPPSHVDGAPTLRWIRTISSRYLLSPNSVALTSPTSFFVSNDHLMTRRLPGILGKVLPMTETLLALPLGFIGHVAIVKELVHSSDAAVIRHTLPKLYIPFPNGIALSPDGRSLAVASSSLASLFIFNRTLPLSSKSGHPGELKLASTIQLPFPPDNVRFDDSGAILVAGHPYFPALTAISGNTSITGTSPSWIVELIPRESDTPAAHYSDAASYPVTKHVSDIQGKYTLRTVYQSDGLKVETPGSFSSSATGVRDSRTGAVILSGLYAEEGVLICVPKMK